MIFIHIHARGTFETFYGENMQTIKANFDVAPWDRTCRLLLLRQKATVMSLQNNQRTGILKKTWLSELKVANRTIDQSLKNTGGKVNFCSVICSTDCITSKSWPPPLL